ncbi:heme oxygenase-like protein [Amniculicola lignicola CBS 123094]|uniref:Heme oxygenase-like protein n=1 Tax=Amniculicola lignicola CBS 123094 TaxID=1392246 RepID=A0A6A5WL58_9PLEO|nr:heme oxygenase-like protein [Amniculicola lignicola CBS 123094]
MADNAISPPSLSTEINIATRSLHTTLNRLITSRLPLALPPHTHDPTLYTTGLIHFAHIFLTFESLWTDLFPLPTTSPSPPPTSPLLSFLLVNPYDSPDLFSSPPSPRMLAFLQTLRPKGLPRSTRLAADLEFLTGLHPTDLSVMLAHYPGDAVQDYCLHIRRTVKHKPHVLVAYAWCFYMAVFSGGRWIRGELRKAGPEFWATGTGPEADNEKKANGGSEQDMLAGAMGLGVWNFDGENDGEDIKAEFKERLAEAEMFFTPDERVDVIEEAKQIFGRCAGLVDELDDMLGTDLQNLTRLDAGAGKLAKETEREAVGQAELVTPTKSQSPSQAVVTWLRKPEVTGAAVALGCLVCFALLKMDPVGGW